MPVSFCMLWVLVRYSANISYDCATLFFNHLVVFSVGRKWLALTISLYMRLVHDYRTETSHVGIRWDFYTLESAEL